MSDYPLALPAGTMLDAEYRVTGVLGSGGFGITYLAEELSLNRRVAIKEYFPTDFAVRASACDVRSKSQNCSGDYKWGLDRFISEAQTLARFNDQNIVRVYRYFLANNTAYMVLQYEDGLSLKDWLVGLGRAPRQNELDRILDPLLDALEIIHANDFLHRDIAPDNIIIRGDDTPVLIDFGSARGEIAHNSKTVSAIVKPGYSPFEQYAVTSRNQGPWTDIYSLGATLYHVITGERPTDSPTRVVKDELPSAAERARSSYRPEFLAGIDHALRVLTEDRPQSVAEWRASLLAPPIIPLPSQNPDPNVKDPSAESLGADALGDPHRRTADRFNPVARNSIATATLDAEDAVEIPIPANFKKQKKAPAKQPSSEGPLARLKAKLNKGNSKGVDAPKDAHKADPDAGHAPAGAAYAKVIEPAATAKPAQPIALDLPKTAAVFEPSPDPSVRLNSVEVVAKRDPRLQVNAKAKAGKQPKRLMDLLAEADGDSSGFTAVEKRPGFFQKFGALNFSLPKFTRPKNGAALGAVGKKLQVAQVKYGQWKVAADERAKERRLEKARQQELAEISRRAKASDPAANTPAPASLAKKKAPAAKSPKLRLPQVPKLRLPRPKMPGLPKFSRPVFTWRSFIGPAAVCSVAIASATVFVTYQDTFRRIFPGLDQGGWSTTVSRNNPMEPQTFSAHEGQVTALRVTADGKWLVSGGADRRLRIWNTRTGSVVKTLHQHSASINAIAIEGTRAVSADAGGVVLVWDTQTGKVIQRVKHHDGLVWSVAFAPDGRAFASAGQDGKIKVWNPNSEGFPSATLDHSGAVMALAYLDNNGRILAAGADRRVRLWEPGSEKIVRTYRGHRDKIAALAVAPNQRRFASGGFDQQIRVWSTQSRKLVRRLRGHKGRITSLMFTPDGRYLLSGSSDQTVKIWNTRSRYPLKTLKGLKSPVTALAVTPDGEAVIAGAEDGSIRIWPINDRSSETTQEALKDKPRRQRPLRNLSLVDQFQNNIGHMFETVRAAKFFR